MIFRFVHLVLLTIFFSQQLGNVFGGGNSCRLRDERYGKVCVCTVFYCDYLDNPELTNEKDVLVISSSQEGLRFSKKRGQFDSPMAMFIRDHLQFRKKRSTEEQSVYYDPIAVVVGDDDYLKLEFDTTPCNCTVFPSVTPIMLNITRSIKYQKIIGFGGALTGSVSYLLTKLPWITQDLIYKAYYHPSGIGYNMLRITIGGSDFDLRPWAYNELPELDAKLTNFTKLDARDEVKVDQIKRIKLVSGLRKLKIKAAAWSPPKWMKSNNAWSGFSYLKPEFYQTWANYHLKFLELMDAENLPLWAISTGNEPLNGYIGWLFVRFMSLGWTPRNQAIWLDAHLGPTLKSSKFRNVLILSNDDQRYTFPYWFKKMEYYRQNCTRFIDGLAVHWYWDSVFNPKLIDATMKQNPGKILLNTESCIGDKPWEVHGPTLGSWERAERYIKAFFQDFKHSFNGWIDWNLALNEQGGPNYARNYVDSPIIINATSGLEFYKQPMYYAIGHFSKFVPEGSVRIDTSLSSNEIKAIAFQRPDKSIALIVFNGNDEKKDFIMNDSVRGPVLFSIPPHSIHTIMYA